MWRFIALLLFAIPAYAQQHPIDKACASCITKAESAPDFLGEPGPARSCEGQALYRWNKEMTRLLAQLPEQRAAQAAWVRQRDKHIAGMKREFMAGTDIKSESELPMTAFDEIRYYQISATRQRVLALTKLTHGQLFTIPKE